MIFNFYESHVQYFNIIIGTYNIESIGIFNCD